MLTLNQGQFKSPEEIFLLFPGSQRASEMQFHIEHTGYQVKNILHFHLYYQLWYVECGSMLHSYNGKTYQMNPGDMVIIPPKTTHALDTSHSEGIKLFGCSFSEEFISKATNRKNANALFELIYLEPLLKDPIPFLSFSDEEKCEIEKMFIDLCNCNANDDYYYVDILAKFICLMNAIANKYTAVGVTDKNEIFAGYRMSIQKSLDYINANFTKDITLNKVCKIAMMSPSRFSIIFKSITGKTLIEYLKYRRIFLGMDLLRNTDRTVDDIGMECGFSSQTYFGRVFKQLLGFSPTEYRRDCCKESIR